jgi:simple sugar transport system ATP-binding protein
MSGADADPPRFRPEPGAPPIVALRGIVKTFPGVLANSDVDLDVAQGEIHALLGENGAGKSTLMNILTGIYAPDAGEILIDGYPAAFASPVEAIAKGIGMVHQHFKLVRAFTVAENVHLGWSETPARISARDLEARTAALAASLNLEVEPGARIEDLSIGEQQRVEILRVLSRKARLLILDEPTAVLTPSEARQLFAALRAFAARGNAVIFISHKLDEVMEIADRITVLRGGKKIATIEASGTSARELATMMVGREIVLGDMRGRGARPAAAAPPMLALEEVSATIAGKRVLSGVTLSVAAGEILGIAGVAGNGQKELSQLVAGLLRPEGGRIRLDGRDMTGAGSAAFAAAGVGHIPEDRMKSGLAPALSVAENAVLREYTTPPVSVGGRFSRAAAAALAESMAKAAAVLVPDARMPVRNLSGGNQQRLVARREMRIANRLLIAAYPSRGLDVGAINAMLRYLVEIRDAGAAVLFFSEELEELLSISDRIAVMFHGSIMGVAPAEPSRIEEIGLMMGGRLGGEGREKAA